MKPEILLKAYVQYQSEEAFRELVAGTLDEVYSTAFRIVHEAPHLAEETVLRVYCELGRKAWKLGEDVVLASWLHEQTCKLAVTVLHEADRAVDRAALKQERQLSSTANDLQPAPAGLAIRVCQGVLLSAPRHKGLRLSLWPTAVPAWVRPSRVGAAAVCVLVILILWNIPFHRRNPIIKSHDLQLSPASFGQLAIPEEGWAKPNPVANANVKTNLSQP